jgi:nitrogen PTS system EIIA component
MTLVSQALTESHILLDLDVSSKKRLFEQIGLTLENTRQVPRAKVFDSLFERERLGSTGLGYGVAIPHGRIKALKETLCVFVRMKDAIAFESPDGGPVRVVFAMLVPEHATEQHLQMLSELAQMLSDEKLRGDLGRAPSVEAVKEIVAQWTPYSEQRAA